MKRNRVNKLIEICLNIADLVDEQGENNDFTFADSLGLGYRALSGYLRSGVKDIIELQASYRSANERAILAEIGEKDIQGFVEEVFGDPEPQTINDKDKARIKEFVQRLMEEGDKAE